MNVRKFVGRCLMAIGLLLMFVGTATVPSTSHAGFVAEVEDYCDGNCNNCGTPQDQGMGRWECLREDGGVVVNGTCATDNRQCKKCSGGCTVKTFEGNRSCVCDNT